MSVTSAKQVNTDRLINMLIGAGDGIIVPSALLAGMTAAALPPDQILRTGCWVAGVAAIIMGVGGYLTRKHAELQPRNIVKDEMTAGRAGSRELFSSLGMTEEMQETAIREMKNDDEEWQNFIDRYDLDPSTETPARSGLIIGISYALAGGIALVPFMTDQTGVRSLVISVAICLPILFVLGGLKGKLTGQRFAMQGLKLLATGILAIAAAYGVVRLFMG